MSVQNDIKAKNLENRIQFYCKLYVNRLDFTMKENQIEY